MTRTLRGHALHFCSVSAMLVSSSPTYVPLLDAESTAVPSAAQTMLHDRYLFDESKERGGGEGWTVDTYLDDLEQRYGGVDSVLLWHSYPNIGVDDRNQFDMLDSLPGGRDGVRRLVAAFHARGVRVLLPYNPWDQVRLLARVLFVKSCASMLIFIVIDIDSASGQPPEP